MPPEITRCHVCQDSMGEPTLVADAWPRCPSCRHLALGDLVLTQATADDPVVMWHERCWGQRAHDRVAAPV